MDIIKVILMFVGICVICYKLPVIVTTTGKWVKFFKWKFIDFYRSIEAAKRGEKYFAPFGLKMFCGRQGSGKTVGMVWYLDSIRKKYPKCHIYTNFDYTHQTEPLKSLQDLLWKRNGTDGVVFAIDEIQNEFSSLKSKDFPETVLSMVTQQRKQRICILTSSQVFTRVAKPLREQCYEVIDCRTFGGRWTRLRCYDGEDYNTIVDNLTPETRFKLQKKWKKSFIQTDELRNSYDTYAVVQKLADDGVRKSMSV